MSAPALLLADVEVRAGDDVLLRVGTWEVAPGEHWAVIGPNGAGKSTLLHVVAGRRVPERGRVEVCGEPHGAPGWRDPQLRLGMLEGAPRTFARQLTGLEIVVLRQGGPAAVLGAARDPGVRDRALAMLELLGAAHLAGQRYASCSQGERQRVLLAQALMHEPAMLLLDEPVAALDLPGREALLQTLETLAARRPALASVSVTHHLEELPVSTTHALLLREGEVVAAGTVEQVLIGSHLSRCFGVPVSLVNADGRWAARVSRAATAA